MSNLKENSYSLGSVYGKLVDYGNKNMTEALGWGATGTWEIIRHAESIRGVQVTFSEEPLKYFFIHNSGDLKNGYEIAFLTNFAFELFAPKTPERFRVSTSLALACGSVLLAEATPLISFLSTPDLADIPAGIAGALACVGLHLLGRKFSRRNLNDSNHFT